jgi:pyruvate/2-oxoglutarate dehydrogenase complex dihydrolipoamide acyltransferase (E2) component
VSSSHTEDTQPAASSQGAEGDRWSELARTTPGAAGSTPVQVTMPQMGVSVAEGTIVEWRKRAGDWVEADEPVCDVTTDKVDVEIPSPVSGRLERILVEPGTTVDVGTPLAEIDPAARPGEAHPEEEVARQASQAVGRDAGTSHREPATSEIGARTSERAAGNGEGDRSRFFSPVVRRIAEKHGVDLTQVTGTGIGGRVRKKDVQAHIQSHEGAAAETPAQPVLHIESPYQPEEEAAPAATSDAATDAAAAASAAGAPPPRLVEELAPGRREPMSPMRQAIARHMVGSRRTAAHCTTIVEADFSRVAARRGQLREQMRRRDVNLTYLAFVARATVEALEEHPRLNAAVDGDEIVYHDDVNLGIAVALEDGLIVPVIRRAQRLSLEGTAAAIADLAERARTKRLEPDEVHGGTFTITNPGQFGAVLATPIINQPQVAILDLEAIVKRPVVVEGAEGDSIVIHPMTYLCMSWDHRALDGADAARFLGSVKDRLERWEASR